MKHVLIADDSSKFLAQCLKNFTSKESSFYFDTVVDPDQCFEKLMTQQFDLLMLDITFKGSDTDGLKMIKRVRAIAPKMPIMMISNDDATDTMINAKLFGADGYASKSRNTMDDIFNQVQDLAKNRDEDAYFLERGREIATKLGVSFASEATAKVFATVARFQSAFDTNVLITGETGTGKDAVARGFEIPGKPFVAINCSNIQESLLDAQLFGSVRGAYTDSRTDTKGLLELANGGVLFLDEIACLPLKAQAGLLRFLENGQFRKLGNHELRETKSRVISATNEDLAQKVKQGLFREDLLPRIAQKEISLLPLNQRREDIIPIAEYYAKKFGPAVINEDLKSVLQVLRWPFNARSVRDCVRAMISENSRPDILSVQHLPTELLKNLGGQEQPVSLKGTARDEMRHLIEEQKAKLGDGFTWARAAKNIGVSEATIYRFLKAERSTSP